MSAYLYNSVNPYQTLFLVSKKEVNNNKEDSMPATATQFSVKPLADRVVIEVENDNEQTAGGIYIPDTAREKPQRGVVIAVGPGKMLDSGKREEMSLKAGDRVLFQKYGGTDIKIENKEYKILSERDILGIIEG
jgi:chaperonin GroES